MQKKFSFLSAVQIAIILVSAVLSVYFYQHFPARVPIHWNVAGQADNWGSKAFGAFTFPVLLVGIYTLFGLLPKIDPRKERYGEFKKAYSVFKTVIMLVLFSVYVIASLNALGYTVSVGFWVPFAIGLMFIVLGNYFGKVRHNYFVGIRTPWTLANEEVWNKTHRLGGKLFIVAGIMMMFMGLAPVAFRLPLFIGLIVIAVVFPLAYSYVLHKRLSK